ncbi:MAG: hypothetical protein JW839_20400, partial [Candidatus Lokiarchaeota archaeon]|nr:hypothetical protein [Candidatus Lokiarchaeota archaeon]
MKTRTRKTIIILFSISWTIVLLASITAPCTTGPASPAAAAAPSLPSAAEGGDVAPAVEGKPASDPLFWIGAASLPVTMTFVLISCSAISCIWVAPARHHPGSKTRRFAVLPARWDWVGHRWVRIPTRF